ncbi:hypothetical protein J14TS2_52750 [Bacillus sp. J14TS2]|uniref:DnaD domain protein n=1 Tax=Bacillus sp. J14TS2 TaxID=2807188 RepID=UPI001B007762|nr:DnaD domain protein [Bacillus sp. J14TS2]GIN74800.1 hypothetical protein J14TS2_52750 [Bacillus sp. J14TS2]
MSKEEQFIKNLEGITPKELLEALSEDGRACERELKIISDVMNSEGLPTPVMNVLVHYVFLKDNMKLSRPYLQKIASHWSDANLKTAEEAMTFAKNRHKSRQSYEKTISTPQPPATESKSSSPIEKPFTNYEYKYMEQLYDKYKMNFDVSREIILYGRNVNQGLLLYWFLNAVSSYVYRHNVNTVEDTKNLLKVFHKEHVETFGLEKKTL